MLMRGFGRMSVGRIRYGRYGGTLRSCPQSTDFQLTLSKTLLHRNPSQSPPPYPFAPSLPPFPSLATRLTSSPQGLIFVIDSQDTDRIDEARLELERILADREMRDCLLLVFANKQDLPGGKYSFPGLENREADCGGAVALSPAKVTERLGLGKMKDRSWFVHPRYAASYFSFLFGQCGADDWAVG